MVRLALVIVPLIALAGCKTENPAFCDNPANAGLQGCPGDATGGGACERDQDCTQVPGLSICDTALNPPMCVACTEQRHDACTSQTPACVNDECHACTQHAQCPSRACLPDGSCADTSQVAYVRPGGVAGACTDAAPCGTLSDGVKAKSIVKIEGTISDDKVTTIDGKVVTVLADPGAQLTRSTGGDILDVRNDGADVRIYDLTITNGTGAKTDAAISLGGGTTPKLMLTRVKIDGNVGIGVEALSGTLVAAQSAISNNTGGGVSIMNAQFDLTNNFIVGNGAATNAFGGVLITQANIGKRVFEFNTITNNSAATVTGVSCVSVAQPVTFSNSIVFENQVGNGRIQTGGTNCNWMYSDIGDSTQVNPDVDPWGNRDADPMFLDTTNIDPKKLDYHLKSTSPLRNTADPAATINIDIDGNVRPQDNRSDMGADEITP